jgi:hypothetical protein
MLKYVTNLIYRRLQFQLASSGRCGDFNWIFWRKNDTSGGVFDALKGNLRDLQVKSFKQCTILNYLGMCKEGKRVMMHL